MTTITTLREEIDELLYREMFEPYGISQTNFIRDGVLRIFEKRIDSFDEWINATPKEKVDRAIKNKELDRKQYDSFKDGFQEAIKMIRKELLLK